MIKKPDAIEQVISRLSAALREMKAGHEPPFFLMLYPTTNPDRSGNVKVDTVMLFEGNSGDNAKQFYDLITESAEEFKKQYALAVMDIDPNDFEAFKAKISDEIAATVERGLDNLRKDPDLKDTKLAEKMLRELSEKRAN